MYLVEGKSRATFVVYFRSWYLDWTTHTKGNSWT